MQAVKSKGTKLERRFFSMLAGLGLRGWTKNAYNIAGKPDVAFANEQIAIFVDGCFWHGCPQCKRKLPKTNRSYWQNKIRRNVALAQSYDEQLHAAGWTVIRIWEHEFQDKAGMQRIRTRILHALEESKCTL